MTIRLGIKRQGLAWGAAALAIALSAPVVPGHAQDNAEARLRRVEAEVRALQRKVFPDGAGRTFSPEIPQATPTGAAAGAPASSALTDTLVRMDALEAQVARLTAQLEENTNRINRIEARLGPAPDAAPAATGPAATGPAATGPAVSPSPAPAAVATPRPAPAQAQAQSQAQSSPPPATRPAATPAAPSDQRLAAVRAIAKPQTDDPGDDEYSYGFRLWEAKFYPEAQQQLKLMIDRYPRHARISFARNLLGRAYLDGGNPREAGSWFLQNYQADKRGARAPDSLLFLAEAMRRLKDTSRACIALAEFNDTYPAEAAGRLKAQYDQTRATVKCN